MFRRIYADICDLGQGPAYSTAMLIEETGAFGGVGDEDYLGRVLGGEGVEVDD